MPEYVKSLNTLAAINLTSQKRLLREGRLRNRYHRSLGALQIINVGHIETAKFTPIFLNLEKLYSHNHPS